MFWTLMANGHCNKEIESKHKTQKDKEWAESSSFYNFLRFYKSHFSIVLSSFLHTKLIYIVFCADCKFIYFIIVIQYTTDFRASNMIF